MEELNDDGRSELTRGVTKEGVTAILLWCNASIELLHVSRDTFLHALRVELVYK